MTLSFDVPRTAAAAVDPLLDTVLRHAIALGVVVLLLVPAARGDHAQLGWLPLWLLVMPLVAWGSLHWFATQSTRHSNRQSNRPAPRVPVAPAGNARRTAPQARRRAPQGRVERPRPARVICLNRATGHRVAP